MKINISRFYRLDFCFRNLSLGFIAILSLDFIPDILPATLAILQILLIQMHSFSMNNIYDSRVWNENNYSKKLRDSGLNAFTIYLLAFAPLLLIFFLAFLMPDYSWILLTYTVLFYLYQTPGIRLKNHYLLSLIINSFCLGTVLYAYPYLVLSGAFSAMTIILGILFFLYLAFHEIIHQIAHNDTDKILSFPKKIGFKNSFFLAIFFLILASSVAVYGIIIDFNRYLFLSGAVIFNFIRIVKMLRMPYTIESAKIIRYSADKFLTAYEGIYFIVFLLIGKIWNW